MSVKRIQSEKWNDDSQNGQKYLSPLSGKSLKYKIVLKPNTKVNKERNNLQMIKRGRREGSLVKSTLYSFIRSESDAQHHMAAHNYLYLQLQGIHPPLLALKCIRHYHTTHTYCRQKTHVLKIKTKIKKVKRFLQTFSQAGVEKSNEHKKRYQHHK